jgi:hypothetical protein
METEEMKELSEDTLLEHLTEDQVQSVTASLGCCKHGMRS